MLNHLNYTVDLNHSCAVHSPHGPNWCTRNRCLRSQIVTSGQDRTRDWGQKRGWIHAWWTWYNMHRNELMNRNMALLLHVIERSRCVLVQKENMWIFWLLIGTWTNKRAFFFCKCDFLTVLMVSCTYRTFPISLQALLTERHPALCVHRTLSLTYCVLTHTWPLNFTKEEQTHKTVVRPNSSKPSDCTIESISTI